MAQRQVNIRLPDEDVTVLEAASFLEGEPLAELVRQVLLAEVDRRRAQPRVRQAMKLREEQDAEARGTLRSLDARRKGRPAGGDTA